MPVQGAESVLTVSATLYLINRAILFATIHGVAVTPFCGGFVHQLSVQSLIWLRIRGAIFSLRSLAIASLCFFFSRKLRASGPLP